MHAATPRALGPALAATLLWLLLAMSVVYWWLKLGEPAATVSAVTAAAPTQPETAAIARLLGGSARTAVAAGPPPEPAASRFSLFGVVASRADSGAALISVDGKPARPYRVGSQVDAGLVLHSVAPKRAMLASGPDDAPTITLELAAARPSVAAGAGSPPSVQPVASIPALPNAPPGAQPTVRLPVGPLSPQLPMLGPGPQMAPGAPSFSQIGIGGPPPRP